MAGEAFGEDPFDLRSALVLLRRRKWWVIAASLLVGVAAFGMASRQTPVYSASAELLLTPPRATAGIGAATSQDVATELVLMRAAATQERIREHLGWLPAVSVSAGSGPGVAVVTATSDDADGVAEAANAYAEAYIVVRRDMRVEDLTTLTSSLVAQMTELDRRITDIDATLAALAPDDPRRGAVGSERSQLEAQRLAYASEVERTRFQAGLVGDSVAEILSSAWPATVPISPTPKRDAAAGAFVGLLLGIGAVILVSRLDDRIQTSDEVERIAGAPVLGLIPVAPEGQVSGRQRLAMSEAHSAAAEAFRSLRTALQFLGLERKLQVVLVTSANPAEGKTATVANLGAALADAGQRVVVIGADLRHPRLGRYFGSEEEVGFTSVLLGDTTLEASLQAVSEHPGLAMLGAGPSAPNPSELLGSAGAANLIAELRGYFDTIIIDSPPVLPVSDALVLSQHADATVVVAQSERTTQRSLRRAMTLLHQVGSPVIGAVVNRADAEAMYGYGYGYGYRYGDQTPRKVSVARRLLRRTPA